MLPRESYGGEVVAYSDDKGDSWSVSQSLFSPGLDESNVAQTSNGSLFAVMRNCFTKAGGVAHGCSLSTNDDGQLSAGPSAHRVAVSVSNDGGQFWTKPRLHSTAVGQIIPYYIRNDQSVLELRKGNIPSSNSTTAV